MLTSAAAASAEAAAASGLENLSPAVPAVHTVASLFGDAGFDVTAMVCLGSPVVIVAVEAGLSAAGELAA